MIDDAARVAAGIVGERFPHSRAAWLGGSAATKSMTVSSDLDITVLVSAPQLPRRESHMVGTQPVEMFVHTEDSLRYFCAQDLQRRRPTLLRLIGTSIVLVDTDGTGARLQAEFHRRDQDGPPALSTEEVDAARYAVTDLLDDLAAAKYEALSVASTLWQQTADLVLGANARWSGTGKWLQRELEALDADQGTDHAEALLSGLAGVARGQVTAMNEAVMAALAPLGGRLFEGYRRDGHPSNAEPKP